MRGGGGPGGMMGGQGGGGGMMGGRGGGGPGGMMGGGGPGGMMGGRGGGMPGGEPGGMMGGRDRGGTTGGRDRGGRGSTPPGQDGESNEDRFARFEGMLRGFDANKDGVIDPKEVPEDRRRFLGFIGGRMGVDFSKPVSIDKLRKKASEQFGGKKNTEPEPLVPGFGIPQEETVVIAFGERPPEEASSGSSSRAGNGSGGGEQNARAAGFADMMMRRYDRDGNGVLEKSKGEWEGVRGDPNEIDGNKDGRIDRNEMVARVAAYMGGNQGGGGDRGGDRGGRGDQQAEQSVDDGRRSYRFLSATERLPEGLPDWFKDRDANQDGQVSMAEYSSYWSDSKAREYLHYDLNDDGIVTPGECLSAASNPGYIAPAVETPAAATPEGGSPPGEPKPDEKKEEKTESSGDKPWWQQ